MIPDRSIRMLSDIQGSNFDASTDSLEVIRNNIGVSVQRGETTIIGGNSYVDVTITAVTLNEACLIFSYYDSSANYDVKGHLTSITNIRFTRNNSGGSTTYIAWQVIE